MIPEPSAQQRLAALPPTSDILCPNAGPCDRRVGGPASSTASTVRPVADTQVAEPCYDLHMELTGAMTLDVKVTKMPEVEVGNGGERHKTSKTGVLFEVRDESGLLGRFQVATGGVRWWRGAAQTSTAFVPWVRIVEYLENQR